MYGAKLQLHLSPRRLPILHFRIVRHSFRRSFPSFLPSFLSFFFLPPSLSLLSPFFTAIADFSPRGPLLRDTSRPDFLNEFPPTVRYSTNIHRFSASSTWWKRKKFTESRDYFFFFFKREKEEDSKKDYVTTIEYSGSVCSGMKIISSKSEIIFVFGCE